MPVDCRSHLDDEGFTQIWVQSNCLVRVKTHTKVTEFYIARKIDALRK